MISSDCAPLLKSTTSHEKIPALPGLAGAFEVRSRGLADALDLGDVHPRCDAGVHLRRHVTRAPFDLRLETFARQLVALRFRGEPLLDQVVGRVLVLFGERRRTNAIERDVVIGEDQPAWRRKRAGPAAIAEDQADRRVAQFIEIGRRQTHAVFRGNRIERQLIDPPHAFVGDEHRSAGRKQEQRRDSDTSHTCLTEDSLNRISQVSTRHFGSA